MTPQSRRKTFNHLKMYMHGLLEVVLIHSCCDGDTTVQSIVNHRCNEPLLRCEWHNTGDKQSQHYVCVSIAEIRSVTGIRPCTQLIRPMPVPATCSFRSSTAPNNKLHEAGVESNGIKEGSLSNPLFHAMYPLHNACTAPIATGMVSISSQSASLDSMHCCQLQAE